MISDEERASWRRDGYLHLRSLLDWETKVSFANWVSSIASWRPREGEIDPVIHTFEATAHGLCLARTENLVPNHEGMRRVLTGGSLPAAASVLLGTPVVLFDEEVRYAPPGGAGIAARQNASMHRFVDGHLTAMVAIDAATNANGCLELVAGHHRSVSAAGNDGAMRAHDAEGLTWRSIEMEPGDVLFFHSRTPHRSSPNRSLHPQRSIFGTYNARSQGDLRAAWHEDKVRRRRIDERSHLPERMRS